MPDGPCQQRSPRPCLPWKRLDAQALGERLKLDDTQLLAELGTLEVIGPDSPGDRQPFPPHAVVNQRRS